MSERLNSYGQNNKVEESEASVEVSVIQWICGSRRTHFCRSLARHGSSQVKADLHLRIERVDPSMILLEFESTDHGEEPERAVE
jgi:hypothetical protein